MPPFDKLVEKIAEIEHKQWEEWAAQLIGAEDLSRERCLRWVKLFVPYSKLAEEQKEQDRYQARKVIIALLSDPDICEIDREAELPGLKHPRMKLSKLKEVIDKTVEYAENTDPSIIFYVGEDEYELDNIGQFGVIPDVTIHIHDSKAGWGKLK